MQPPLVIGAMGGSGTRVVARLVQRAGVFLGTHRNESEDAMEFVALFDRWINRYVRRDRVPLTAREAAALADEFGDCVVRHRAGLRAEHLEWGWKEPRSIYLLPFFHERFPGMRFVHVIRDGRDMAFSANQNQLRKHGSAVLTREHDLLPPPAQTAGLWNAVNLMAADFGETVLAERYLRLRFEDLCRDPEAVSRTVFAFLGRDTALAADVISEVAPPSTLGRWRTAPNLELLAAIHKQAEPALNRFGYSA